MSFIISLYSYYTDDNDDGDNNNRINGSSSSNGSNFIDNDTQNKNTDGIIDNEITVMTRITIMKIVMLILGNSLFFTDYIYNSYHHKQRQ